MINFCTLFDINFATQGIAMYESLKENCEDFHLYIFAFCDQTLNLLKKLNLEKATVISLNDFEDKELLKVKPARTNGEYCWTCTPSAIKYCLEKYNLDNCTYIDADLQFYSNPKVLIDEMGDKSVLITEHRFTPKHDQSGIAGKYCVQFITFKNTSQGLEVLDWWRKACIEWCYNRYEDGKFGDQKYLDDWAERFDCVHVLKHLGGGVAPWNIHRYRISKVKNKLHLTEKSSKKSTDVIFYHFHSVKILSSGKIDLDRYNIYNPGCKIWFLIYVPYLKKLRKISKKLKKLTPEIGVVKIPVFNFKLLKKYIRGALRLIFNKQKFLRGNF